MTTSAIEKVSPLQSHAVLVQDSHGDRGCRATTSSQKYRRQRMVHQLCFKWWSRWKGVSIMAIVLATCIIAAILFAFRRTPPINMSQANSEDLECEILIK